MSFAVKNISKNWPHVLKIKTDFPLLDISLFLGDVDQVLRPMYVRNLKDDYVKSLKGSRPENLGIGDFTYDASAKTSRNIRLVAQVEKDVAQCDQKPYPLYRLFYLARLSSEPVATLEIYEDGSAVQFGIFVDRDHSHKGIGTAILNAAKEMLKERTVVEKVIYECNADNDASRKLALKTGFEFTQEFEIYRGRKAHAFALDLYATERSEKEKKRGRLLEIQSILEKAYANCSFIYRRFEINEDANDGYQLAFSCDSYFDPIFSMFALSDYDVLQLRVECERSETDRVIISDGDVDVLKKLPLQDGANELKQFLSQTLAPKSRQPETGPIIIDEIDRQYFVSRNRWNAYWASKGLTGPDSAWTMPTYATICAATPDFDE